MCIPFHTETGYIFFQKCAGPLRENYTACLMGAWPPYRYLPQALFPSHSLRTAGGPKTPTKGGNHPNIPLFNTHTHTQRLREWLRSILKKPIHLHLVKENRRYLEQKSKISCILSSLLLHMHTHHKQHASSHEQCQVKP